MFTLCLYFLDQAHDEQRNTALEASTHNDNISMALPRHRQPREREPQPAYSQNLTQDSMFINESALINDTTGTGIGMLNDTGFSRSDLDSHMTQDSFKVPATPQL